jgi:hypothetical protein
MPIRGGVPSNVRGSIARQARDVLVTGQRFKRFDQVRQRHFWSMQQFSADADGYIPAGEFDIFITPPGQVGQGFAVPLTERETNWRSSNRVPDNQNFDITEIGVGLSPVTDEIDDEAANQLRIPDGPAMNQFLCNTLVAIRYLTNSVELGYCSDFAQASGPTMGTYKPFDTVGQDTRSTTRFALNGMASPGLRRRFKIPIMLQHGEVFSFRFIVPRTYFVGDDVALLARLDFWATESFVERS